LVGSRTIGKVDVVRGNPFANGVLVHQDLSAYSQGARFRVVFQCGQAVPHEIFASHA